MSGIVALLTLGRFGLSPEFRASMNSSDLILSVGGGYLRGGSWSEFAKAALIHGSQMLAAASSGRKWILLPQSIGPFKRAVRPLVVRTLSKAERVYARDDTTMREFACLSNMERSADCAVLEVFHSSRGLPLESSTENSLSGRIGVIVRDLPGQADNYVQSLIALSRLRTDWLPVLQADVGGNDDREFTRDVLGAYPDQDLESCLAHGSLAAMVSVRLHGALMAILAGIPAIHISYERKGYSAFRDLGLAEYVFNARSFSPQEVGAALESIIGSPAAYWQAISSARERVTGMQSSLIATIRSVGT